MTRGNQREIDRARAQKKLEGKGQKKEGDKLQRNAADKDALQQKIKMKEERRLQEEAASAVEAERRIQRDKQSSKKKAGKKGEEGLDDLLNAGLQGGKKGKRK